MITKGLTTEQQEIDYKRKNNPICSQAMYEFFMKGMMRSCFTYGGYKKGTYNYDNYKRKYIDSLGAEVFEEVYEEMANYLDRCFVVHGVYTDFEGVTYNGIREY